MCGDVIELPVFKMTHNIYDPDVSLKLEYNWGCSTTGNKYKLLRAHFTMICENIISLHVSLIFGTVCQTTLWMSVLSTMNQFKARLDKYWMHQDVLYDYTTDLTGIGDRSVYETNDV